MYRSDLDFTLATERKLLPKFSAPRRVVSRNKNSYQRETLEGFPIAGKFSSRRLRQFLPRQGTELERTQARIEEEWRRREEEGDRVENTGKPEEDDAANEREESVDKGARTIENQWETEGTNQTHGPTCVDTSSGGS